MLEQLPSAPVLAFATTSIWLLARYLYKRTAPSLRNVRGPPPDSFFLGNIPQLISEDGDAFHTELTQNYGKVVKLHALLGGKHLYVFDHAAMEAILFQVDAFNMPDIFVAANHVMFGPCLVSTIGAQHRKSRKIMNPVFSPSRLRDLVPILYGVAHQTSSNLAKYLSPKTQSEIDILPILGSTALEFIGQAGLGHSFSESNSDALHAMKQLLFAAKRMIVPMQILPLLLRTMSPGLRRKLIDYVPLPDLHLARDLVDILDATTKSILAKKKEGLRLGDSVIKEQIGQGKDIISLLLKACDSEDGQMSEEELLGQMNVILFAGIDTTSTTIARCLQELSKNHVIQGRLRDEIANASIHGDLDYETLCDLPLLDAVARETLRMYPTAITSSREALKDSVLPLSTPMIGVDGTPMTEVFVPKGTVVHIGLRAANQDRTIWGDDATEWKPERWLKPLPDEVVNSKIPGAHPKLMTFIGGPRGCIGYKFAEISMKVLLSVLIQDFEFSPSRAEIIWKLGQAEAPTVDGKQAMPIVVTARASS